MDRETRLAIMDYFTAAELTEYLDISVEDIIDNFDDEIEEALDDILELMGVIDDSEIEEED